MPPIGDESQSSIPVNSEVSQVDVQHAQHLQQQQHPQQYNIGELCRVCLVPTVARKNSNLFFAGGGGRAVQLWAKVMACAWVQVFEGDGLPSQICYKCNNKLDIAYQFKQQCEAADAYIRQLLSRSQAQAQAANQGQKGGGGGGGGGETMQNASECLAECKPLNFNITTECLDLVQSDLSLPALRLTSQDIPPTTPQATDFRLGDSDFAAMKQEPGFINAMNSLQSHSKSDCQSASSNFKCESFNDSDILLENLPAKLFESVNETLNRNSADLTTHIESKMAAVLDDWSRKDAPVILSKNDFIFATEGKSDGKNGKEASSGEHVDITFLTDDRSVSPLTGKCMLPDVCSDSSAMEIDNECSFGNNAKEFSQNITFENTVVEKAGEVPKVAKQNVVEKTTVVKKKKKKKKIASTKQSKEEKKENDGKKPKRKPVQEQCELCGKVFKYRSYVVQHMRTHTGDKPFTCNYCDQKFTMHHSLATHLRTHTGARPFSCSVCTKSFSQLAGLKSHMRAHTGEQPFECDMCGKKFSQKSNLIIHKKIHTGERDFVCNVCDKAFKFYKHLQSHMVLHSEEKEFKCSVCSKTFHRKSYLQIHLSIHNGERPFKCNVCGHAFNNSSNLRAHTRIHSGIKPFKCEVCKKAFGQSSGLTRHMQQHNNAPVVQQFPSDKTD